MSVCWRMGRLMVRGAGLMARPRLARLPPAPVCQLHLSSSRWDEFSEQARMEREEEQRNRSKRDAEEKLREKILEATLEEVMVQARWSRSAVVAAVTRLGYPSVTAGLVAGMEEVALHHIKASNATLDHWMQEEVARLTADGARLPVGKFIRAAIGTIL